MNRFVWLMSVGVLAWSGAAVADVPPANECSGSMSAGSACSNMLDGGSGTCQETMCSHATYYGDGGYGSSSSPCVLCLPPAASDAGPSSTSDAGPTYGGSDAGAAASADAGSTYYPPADGGPSAPDGGSTTSNSGGGCSSGAPVRFVAPLLLALLVPLMLRRRRG